jgi:hypothetical protein
MICRSSPKIDPKIEILMLKLVYNWNFMMLEHSGRELRRFEDFCFKISGISAAVKCKEKQNFKTPLLAPWISKHHEIFGVD